jgi:hypothetical protein
MFKKKKKKKKERTNSNVPRTVSLNKKGKRRDDRGDPNNVQYKLIWNCHYESPCTTNIS